MEKINCDIIAIVHRFFSEGKRKRGGFDKIIDSFSEKGKKILLIEHPLVALREGENFCNDTIVSIIDGRKITEVERVRAKKRPNVLNWVKEVFFNINYIRNRVNGMPVLMAVDPLNGLAGVICKGRLSKRYYHCIDFSKRRFDNLLLNKVYSYLLKINLKSFDYVGVVSLRIKKELEAICNCHSKIIYIPNSPVFKRVKILEKKENFIICTGGAIIKKYNYDFIIDLMYELKKDLVDVKLYAVGGLDEESGYVESLRERIRKLSLDKNVFFTGFLSSQEVENLMINSRIGISFYSSQSSYYTFYGDSQKIREYALYGIPSISDGNSATDEEMAAEGAGVIVNNVLEAKEKIKLLLNDESVYKQYQKNCLQWAKKMDKDILLKKLYKLIFV
jgi:glycosyltransferase involved in cell wall biosynthesis